MTKKSAGNDGATKDVKKGKSENRFTKKQVLASTKLGYSKDIISTLLVDNKTYTLKEVEAKVNDFLKRKVK